MKVLLIVPAYNEEESIVAVARTIERAGYDYLVINDGSTDATERKCVENNISHVTLIENLGIGGAVQAGHKYAHAHGYDVDIQFDGDGQHDIDCIPKLLSKIEEGADIAIGSRFLDEGSSEFKSTRMRRVGIIWLNKLIKIFSGVKITDATSGFRACNRKAIDMFAGYYPSDYPEPESIVYASKRGLRVDEAPVAMHERQGGTSSIKMLSSIYYMIRVTLAIAIFGLARRRR